MTELLKSMEMTDSQFETVSALVKDLCGINLHVGKKELVKARLYKRIRHLGLSSFAEYLAYMRANQADELPSLMDMLSTNLTFFFREPQHFQYLESGVIPSLVQQSGRQRKIRIWSAGCSSGEEPYSIAVTVRRALGAFHDWDVRILATDLSRRVLALAHEGIYPPERLRETSQAFRTEYFRKIQTPQGLQYQVDDAVREKVNFARLNLMERWPMKGPFDVIFCRNVMIYFDKPTQTKLVNRFWDILGHGGVLFIGHSESLAGAKHKFEYVHPTVYRKA